MAVENLQLQKPRYEYKYVVDTAMRDAFLERILDVVTLDPNAVDGGYHINSVYYDIDDLLAYWEKIDGVDNRFKIRIRYYGEIDEKTDLSKMKIYVEAKHRMDQLLFKNRVKIPGDYLETIQDDQLLNLRLRDIVDSKQLEDAVLLDSLIGQRPLLPMAIVSYYREAYVCRINPAMRITFDSNLRTAGPTAIYKRTSDNGNLFLPDELSIVEIKFHWAMPLWLLAICREVGLLQRRYSKYCSAIETLYPDLSARAMRFQTRAM